MEVDLAKIETEALSWPERARSIAVVSQESYDLGANLIRDISALSDKIIEHHKPIKDAANKAHKAAVAAEKKLLEPLDEAKRIISKALAEYHESQEKLRLENERKALAEARERAEAQRLEEAQLFQDSGFVEEAVKLLDEPLPVQVPIAAPTYRKAAGISMPEQWRAEVVDIKKLCAAVASGAVPSHLVLPNETTLNGLARSLKSALSIPGVVAKSKTGVTVRR